MRRQRTSPSSLRWNPKPDDVQRSVAQLVLTIVEFLRRLMERQAIRRMEQRTLTRKEVEAVGQALMQLETTIRDIGAKFGLTPEDLNLDLGPLGKLMSIDALSGRTAARTKSMSRTRRCCADRSA